MVINKSLNELSKKDRVFEINNNEDTLVFIDGLVVDNVEIHIYSSVTFVLVSRNTPINKGYLNFKLVNSNIDVNIKQLALTKNKESFDYEVDVEHLRKNTNCNYDFLGFAFDGSSIKIKAKNRIIQGMKGSNTHQSLRMFSDGNAIVVGQPGLMIEEFDVVASHGNSIGQIDRRLIYYLQTKGITSKMAKLIAINANVNKYFENDVNNTKDKILAIINEYFEVKND